MKFSQMRFGLAAMAVSCTIVFSGCQATPAPTATETAPAMSETTPSTAPETTPESLPTTKIITDMAGAQVEVPAKVASVINTWPSSNQIMLLLGATGKQIGYIDTLQGKGFQWMQIVNPDILTKPKIGSAGKPITAEELMTLKPDLVIGYNDKDATTYRDAGLAAITVMFTNYDQMKQSTALTAEALGDDAPERAKAFATYLDGNIAKVTSRLADIKDEDKPSVYYMSAQNDDTPYATSGNDTIQEEWIKISGGKLATDGLLKGSNQQITPEQLLTLNPDYILLGGLKQASVYDQLMNDPALAGLDALKNGKVVRIPQGTFQWCRYGAESSLMPLWTAKTLYPDLFTDIDIKAETIAFYKTYLGYDLSSDYADAILAGKDGPEGK